MKELWVSIVPVVASVGSIVVVALGFIAKVKAIIGTKEKQVKELEKQLTENAKIQKEGYEKTQQALEEALKLVKEQQTELEVQREQLAKVVEVVEKADKLVKLNVTLRNQITTLLHKEDK